MEVVCSSAGDNLVTVRVAKTSGGEVGQYAGEQFARAAGFPDFYAAPMVWLDSDTVLIEVLDSDWEKSAVRRLDVNGSITYLVSGGFAGLTYP